MTAPPAPPNEGKGLHEVSAEILVDAPPGAVWAVLSDFHDVDSWAPVFARTVDTGSVSRGVGAARRCHFRGMGSVTEVVTVWDEPRRLSYRVSPLGPIGVAMSHWEIEPVKGGTARVRLRLSYGTRFGPIGRTLDRLILRAVLTRNVPGALALLRREVRRRSRPVAPRPG